MVYICDLVAQLCKWLKNKESTKFTKDTSSGNQAGETPRRTCCWVVEGYKDGDGACCLRGCVHRRAEQCFSHLHTWETQLDSIAKMQMLMPEVQGAGLGFCIFNMPSGGAPVTHQQISSCIARLQIVLVPVVRYDWATHTPCVYLEISNMLQCECPGVRELEQLFGGEVLGQAAYCMLCSFQGRQSRGTAGQGADLYGTVNSNLFRKGQF